MSDGFVLHERLAADCVEVARWPLSLLLLMNDATYPWLILVPQRPGLSDLHDLAPADQPVMTAEMIRASRLLKDKLRADKINVASLGNQVPQLHVHVIARFKSDPAWPGPVWGVAPARPYEPYALHERLELIRAAAAET